MNLLTTLFGGALTVALLFGLLGWLRMPAYWRAVVSCAIPLFAYLVLALKQWPGLDVVSIHAVVFLVTAAILGLVATRRQAGGAKLHWAPKILIGFFAVLFLVNGTLVYLSSHGLPVWLARHVMPDAQRGGANTAFPGVVSHGSEAAKGISAHLKQQARQSELGWQVYLEGLETLRVNQAVPIALSVRDRDGRVMTDAAVVIALRRPAQEATLVSLPVQALRHGEYRGNIRFDAPGAWVVQVRITREHEELVLQQAVTVRP